MKKIFVDFFPLVLFFVAFKLAGIYVATAVAIVSSVVQVIWSRLRQGRFEGIYVMQLVIIGVFGGLTLILHNDTFIRWKPTILYWAFAAAFLGSQLLGRRTLAERMLERQISMPARVWKIYNLSWGLFFLLMGILNLYFAFFYGLQESRAARLDTWVNMKVWGSLVLTVIFATAQALFLSKHLEAPQAQIGGQKDEQ